jgi:threonine/homoserine/homoserine lactone efflux protein
MTLALIMSVVPGAKEALIMLLGFIRSVGAGSANAWGAFVVAIVVIVVSVSIIAIKKKPNDFLFSLYIFFLL